MAFNRPPSDDESANVVIGVGARIEKQEFATVQRDLSAFGKDLNEIFSGGNASEQAAKRRFSAYRAEIERTRAATGGFVTEFREWDAVMQRINRNNVIDAIADDLVKATKNSKDFGQELENVRRNLKEIGASEAEVSRVIAAAQAAQSGGQGRALQTLGREARAALPAVALPGGGSTEGIARLVEVAGRVQTAFGQLSPTMQRATVGAGLLAAGLAVVAVAFNQINEGFARQTRAIINSQEEATRLRLQGSREEIEAAIEQKALDDEVTQARIDENKRLLAALEDQAGPAAAALADILNIGGVQELRKETEKLEQQQADNALATSRLNGLLQDDEVLRRLENEALQAARIARLAEIDALAQSEVQIRSSLSLIAGGTAEAARSRLASLQAEQAAIRSVIAAGEISDEKLEEFNKRLEEIGASADIINSLLPNLEDAERQKKAQEDAKEAQQQLFQLASRAIDIEVQGNQRIGQIREQGLKQIETAEQRLADARAKLVDFNTELEEKRQDINSDFMKDDLKRLDDYIREKKRAQRDADIQEMNDLLSHRAALRSAEFDNDTAAFVAEQDRFKEEQRKAKQQREIDVGDRLEDFERERDKAREVRDEKLAALEIEAQKKRADLSAEIQEREQALQTVKDQIRERVAAEKAAIEQSLKNLVDSFDQSSSKMIATITQGFNTLEQVGISTTTGIIGNLERQSRLVIRNISNAAPPPLPTQNARSGIAFAHGGLPTQRNLQALLNERPGYLDAIIPYRQSEGIERALSRLGVGGGITNNFEGMFKGAVISGVSREELAAIESMVKEAVNGTIIGISALKTGQAPGVN